jgi:hypothetical protein
VQHQGWQVHVQVLGPGPDRCVPVMCQTVTYIPKPLDLPVWLCLRLLVGWGAQMSKAEKG